MKKRLNIPDGDVIACDTETTGVNTWLGDRPFMISFCNEDFETTYLRWSVNPYTRRVLYDEEELDLLRDFFLRRDLTTVWHNSKFDIRMLDMIGVPVRCRVEDTMFVMRTLNTDEINYKLKWLAKKYFDIPTDDETKLKEAVKAKRRRGKSKGWNLGEKIETDYWLCPTLAGRYARKDVERTMALWLVGKERLQNGHGWDVYRREMNLQPLVYQMESRGVKVNAETIRYVKRRNAKQIFALDRELRKTCPEGMKFNSPKQLSQWLYSVAVVGKNREGKSVMQDLNTGLHLPIQRWSQEKKKAKGFGQPSTSIEDIKYFDHPWVRNLIKLRGLESEANNFYDQYDRFKVLDESTDQWIVHPDFRQAGTKTTRFSCATPQLHNTADPKRSKTGSSAGINTRKPFEPRRGHAWVLIDYGQLEVRIFAYQSKERILIDALDSGADVHGATANKVWGGEGNPLAVKAAVNALGNATESEAKRWLEKFNWDIVAAEKSIEKKVSRSKAKNIVFLKIFGGGVRAVAFNTGCTQKEALEILKDFDRQMPGMKTYMDEESRKARRLGYVENAYGRRYTVPADKTYVAVNYNVQGSAADFLKDRMQACDAWLSKYDVPAWLVLTIHDEIVFEVEEHLAEDKYFVGKLCEIMEDHTGHFGIDMKAEPSVTYTDWTDKKKIEL